MVLDDLYEGLKILAPGTELREGLNNILRARTGGLIVIDDSTKVRELIEGGFELNVPFRAPTLYELAKMDGAIIVSGDVKKIVMANAYLTPPLAIPSRETGIRHRVAERMARFTGSMVIAISQRRSLITVYQGINRHVVGEIGFILNKANQAVQTLDKYRVILKRSIDNLTLLELEGAVTLGDVARGISRMEMVARIIREIEIYVSQLGIEGKLIEMQKNQLSVGLQEEARYLLRDYLLERDLAAMENDLHQCSPEELLELHHIGKMLGYGSSASNLDQPVIPRGYRVLSKVPKIPAAVVDNVVQYFGLLPAVLGSTIDQLNQVEGIGEVRARAIREGLQKLREETLLG